ncbi:hypothetical protein [Nocardia fluminea]|uniref:hypothetical protein n=1 Tax=Nocardia fluminea TaxID=134984 RepID=UPI0034242B2B
MEQSDNVLTATDSPTDCERSTARFPSGGTCYQVSSHVPTLSEVVTTLEAMCAAGWITTALERSNVSEGV